MKTSLTFSLVASCTLLLSASVAVSAQKLYPVKGPLAAQTPQPVIAGQIRRPPFSMGSPILLLKSWKLPSGEVLQGKMKTMKPSATSVPMAASTNANPPQPNLASVWDAVFGAGYYIAHILGNGFYQGVFTGNQGTVLQVESLNGEQGVAIDNKGNVFKMVW